MTQNNDNMRWIDEREAAQAEERSKEYFNIAEGDNRFFLLTYISPLAQVWEQAEKKYRLAQEGDQNVSIKGVCWVLQDEQIKLAKLPYTAVKQLRAYQNDPEWGLDSFPWPHQITLNAKNAGSKEVEYSCVLSPKKAAFSEGMLNELAEKDAPEKIIERMKEKAAEKPVDYPAEAGDPDKIPF
jgi:transposase